MTYPDNKLKQRYLQARGTYLRHCKPKGCKVTADKAYTIMRDSLAEMGRRGIGVGG